MMGHRARYGCWKGGGLILALVAAVFACGAAWGSQGDELAQAREAMERQEWTPAVRLLEGVEGLEVGARADAVKKALARCRMHKRLEERYRDGSLAEWMGQLDRRGGRALVAALVEHVESRGLERIEQQEWVWRALEVVKAGLANRCVCEQVGCECVGAAALGCVVDQLRKEEVADALALVRALEGPAEAVGLPDGWAGVTMAVALGESLDKFSYLLGPGECERFYSRLNGAYVGLGVDLRFEERYPRVFDVIAESPAAAAGLRPGDVLLAVAQTELADQGEARVAELLRAGREGPVQLKVGRMDEEVAVEVQAGVVSAKSVRQARMLEVGGRVGAVRVASFGRDTAMELCRAVQGLVDAGAKRVVLDLRCNGGGMVQSAVDGARLFIEQGRIVTVESPGSERVYDAVAGEARFGVDVVVLVDEETASASEIFSAALQYHGRAVVVGRRTRGKGLVQTVSALGDWPVGVCLTTARYLEPGGRCLQGRGVEPDVVVAGRTEVRSVAGWLTGEDAYLAAVAAVVGTREAGEMEMVQAGANRTHTPAAVVRHP